MDLLILHNDRNVDKKFHPSILNRSRENNDSPTQYSVRTLLSYPQYPCIYLVPNPPPYTETEKQKSCTYNEYERKVLKPIKHNY